MNKIQKSYPKKHFYSQKRSNNIDLNLKGFLCSCNNREKDCVRESYNLLNKYADILWPPQQPAPSESSVEDELREELEQLRSEKSNVKRFQVVDSGAKNFLFIKTTVADPVKLAEHILRDISEKKTQETRFLLRLIPVETTCKAYVKDIEKAFEPLCQRHFSLEAKTFSVIYNHRNNSSLSRDEIIKAIANQVAEHGKTKDLDHKVDLKAPQLSVVVEIIRGFAFLGVVPDFFKYKKYNLLAFVTEEETQQLSDNDNKN